MLRSTNSPPVLQACGHYTSWLISSGGTELTCSISASPHFTAVDILKLYHIMDKPFDLSVSAHTNQQISHNFLFCWVHFSSCPAIICATDFPAALSVLLKLDSLANFRQSVWEGRYRCFNGLLFLQLDFFFTFFFLVCLSPLCPFHGHGEGVGAYPTSI